MPITITIYLDSLLLLLLHHIFRQPITITITITSYIQTSYWLLLLLLLKTLRKPITITLLPRLLLLLSITITFIITVEPKQITK